MFIAHFSLQCWYYEFHLNPRGFLRSRLLDLSHIPMHFVLLYWMSLAFSKCISCILRCVRELLFPVYIVVLSKKAEIFNSFWPITIPLTPLVCLIYSKNISTNIIYRIIDNGHPCSTRFFTRDACDSLRLPWPVFLCFDKLFLFSALFQFHIRNDVGFQRENFSPDSCKCFFLVKCYHCCLNLVSVYRGHYVPNYL